MLKEISKRLEGEAFSVPSLKTYRLLYRLYPTLSAPVGSYLSERFGGKGQSAIVQLPMPDGQIGQSPIVPSENQGMIIQADNTVTVSPWHLFLKRENKQDGLA